jgi:hypothetical protein
LPKEEPQFTKNVNDPNPTPGSELFAALREDSPRTRKKTAHAKAQSRKGRKKI